MTDPTAIVPKDKKQYWRHEEVERRLRHPEGAKTVPDDVKQAYAEQNFTKGPGLSRRDKLRECFPNLDHETLKRAAEGRDE